jgi:dipeptidyl aminopeptidase/acylaminoacyl peptidase
LNSYLKRDQNPKIVKNDCGFGAFTDMEALIKYRPEVYQPKMLKQLWPDFETRQNEIFRSRSAVYWTETLDVPLLIMHGGADCSVNPSQSLTIAQKLQDLGRSYELVIYAGDGHILSRNQGDRDRRAIAWFKRHMKPAQQGHDTRSNTAN